MSFKGLLARIRGVSTPLGGISWAPEPSEKMVRSFTDVICVTSPGNERFIGFLRSNDGRIAFLTTHIDACVATEENYRIVDREQLDIDRIAAGDFSGMLLPLPNDAGELVAVTFYFSDRHQLLSSAGGTGVVTVRIVGFFEISSTLHGGPSVQYHLRELDASMDFRVDFMNRADRR